MRTNTRYHNLDFVTDTLCYKQIGSSTLFVRDGNYLLSPSVSEGQNGAYWIDIRQANLEQISDRNNCDLLIRIVPDLFCLCKLSHINKLLSPTLMDNRPNSGHVWGIKLDIKQFKKTVDIRSNRNREIFVTVPLLTKEELLRMT
ncbi:hypothetical protein [Mangrovibacterium diazotrophicum]|uniref:Uncharacterized protein n=1 Tax=Mangrovibacterium diazotrophicum TaxID=1261403 RepID=A0A419W4R3_9BACT|nr:hypothetical protein [Mangrovibacterium diazotrophicum]RKD90432.1 hypothetical protein BC643_0771 [Mangrovibacterium diazotrophicum]